MMQMILGDSVQVLKELPENSIDALVTDPPAGISFMGKEWDSFNGPGFKHAPRQLEEQKEKYGRKTPLFGCAAHPASSKKGEREAFTTFLSGLMKDCLRVVKPACYGLVWAIPRTSHWTAMALEDAGWEIRDCIYHIFGSGFPKGQGCLKPAVECWWLIRKPGKKINPLGIDECRIPTGEKWKYNADKNGTTFHGEQGKRKRYSAKIKGAPTVESNPLGRWPANLILDEEAGQLLDSQVGHSKSKNSIRKTALGRMNDDSWSPRETEMVNYGDSGGPSRFFYCPKTSKSERGEFNDHPTVKPLLLMRWLVKLICPKGGVVLDPFLGSGTTALACIETGRQFIGIEKNLEYFNIATHRIENSLRKTEDLFDFAR